MRFVYSDGGRSIYFKAESVGDCCVRAIANATGKDYKEVYDSINAFAKKERTGKRKQGRSSARNGVYTATAKRYLASIGWEWIPTMTIGSGCTVHLCPEELPSGNLIVNLSRHFSCVKDGVLYDTYDCSRGGTRCVYGYWRKPIDNTPKFKNGETVLADGYLCKVVDFGEDDSGILWYECGLLDGWSGVTREFTQSHLEKVDVT